MMIKCPNEYCNHAIYGVRPLADTDPVEGECPQCHHPYLLKVIVAEKRAEPSEEDRQLVDAARTILSSMKARRSKNPETDTAIEISPNLARGVLRLLKDLAALKGDPDPMEGKGEDDMWDEEEDEEEEE